MNFWQVAICVILFILFEFGFGVLVGKMLKRARIMRDRDQNSSRPQDNGI